MIKIALITIIGTGLLGTGAVQADLTPKETAITVGLVKIEFGGENGFNTSFVKTMEFNIQLISGDGKTVTIRL